MRELLGQTLGGLASGLYIFGLITTVGEICEGRPGRYAAVAGGLTVIATIWGIVQIMRQQTKRSHGASRH